MCMPFDSLFARDLEMDRVSELHECSLTFSKLSCGGLMTPRGLSYWRKEEEKGPSRQDPFGIDSVCSTLLSE